VHLIVDSHDILCFYKAEITTVFVKYGEVLVVKRKRLSRSEENSENRTSDSSGSSATMLLAQRSSLSVAARR
jgi:hypothetical protein